MLNMLSLITYLVKFFYAYNIQLVMDLLNLLTLLLQKIYSFALNYWLAITIIGVVVYKLYNIWHIKQQKRDYPYLKRALSSSDPRLPATRMDDLVRQVIGPNGTEEDAEQVTKIIEANVTSIQRRIKPSSTEKVIIIEAPWGSGKTTSVLLAVEKLEEESPDRNRYIYESAFRYTKGTVEFTHKIVCALGDVLAELGMRDTRRIIEKLTSNLDTSPSQTLLNLLRTSIVPNADKVVMTTDLVAQINQRYSNAKLDVTVYIIIDDLDRLLGHDIYKTLSLLSILRRLSFVKIIIPMEQDIVIQQLEHLHISKPDKFIQKYLPESATIRLETEYSIAEQLALQKLKSYRKSKFQNDTEACAAWAAILLKLFSEILQADSRNWDSSSTSSSTTAISGGAGRSKITESIIKSSNKHVSITCNSTMDSTGRIYDRTIIDNYKADEFEEVFLRVKYTRTGEPITTSFSEDAYNHLVATWVFRFAQQNWTELNIHVRDIMDIINSLDKETLENLSDLQQEQFAQVFNQVFSNKKIQPDKIMDFSLIATPPV